MFGQEASHLLGVVEFVGDGGRAGGEGGVLGVGGVDEGEGLEVVGGEGWEGHFESGGGGCCCGGDGGCFGGEGEGEG